MAKTHNFLTDNDMLDLAKLDEAIVNVNAELQEAAAALKDCEARLKQKTDFRAAIGKYRRTKPTIEAHRKLSGKKADNYHRANEADFMIHEAAKRQLAALVPGRKLPGMKTLQGEIEALISEKNAAYNAYRSAKTEYDELFNVQQNAQKFLRDQQPAKRRSHEQER